MRQKPANVFLAAFDGCERRVACGLERLAWTRRGRHHARGGFASSLLLENFVKPKVKGRALDIHPPVVLVVTASGGLLCDIVGLILAEPATVIAATAIGRLRSKGVDEVAARAKPTVRRIVG